MTKMRTKISRLAGVVTACLIAFTSAASQGSALDELKLLSQLPRDIIAQCKSSADEDGLVGSNRTGPFVADEQREAMDGLVVGLVLQHDDYVERCWRAVTATYDRQTPEGDFAGKRGSSHMRFWMAWSNHAIYLLANSPKYGPLYQERINVLRPKIEKAMDYLTQYGPIQLSNDYKSPNRTMIIATAYLLGARLLDGYADPARHRRYLAEAKRWLDNEFVNDKLFRSSDGLFTENGGYDTSYQALAARFFYYCLIQDSACTKDAFDKGEKAGAFLTSRFLPGGVIDCTYNTRSGLGNVEGSHKKTDRRSCRFALLYYSVLFHHPEALAAARDMGPEQNGLPPALLLPSSATGSAGAPFSLSLCLTNAGLDALDPQFHVEMEDLPSGLRLDPEYTFARSSAFATVRGTPGTSGPVQVRVTAHNRFGASQPMSFTINLK